MLNTDGSTLHYEHMLQLHWQYVSYSSMQRQVQRLRRNNETLLLVQHTIPINSSRQPTHNPSMQPLHNHSRHKVTFPNISGRHSERPWSLHHCLLDPTWARPGTWGQLGTSASATSLCTVQELIL